MNNFINLKKEEVECIENIVKDIKENCPGNSVKEKMQNYLKSTFPEMSFSEVIKVTDSIISAETTFSKVYSDVENFSEDWLKEKIDKATEKFTIAEKYRYLCNILIALRSVDSKMVELNLDSRNFNTIEYYKKLKGFEIQVKEEEITQDSVDMLYRQVFDAVDNSSIAVFGNEEVASLLENMSDEAVVEFVDGNWSDAEFKSFTALAMYIAYQKGQISSLTEEVTPESITVGVCAGVERDKVIMKGAKGELSWEKVLDILKLIGKAAATVLIVYVGVNIMFDVMSIGMYSIAALFGGSIIAMVIGAAAAGFLAYKIGGLFMDLAGNTAGAIKELAIITAKTIINGYKVVRDLFVETVLPKVKVGIKTAKEFIFNTINAGITFVSNSIENIKDALFA